MPELSACDLRRLQEFIDAAWPGHQGGELVVWLPNQRRAVMPLRVYLSDCEPSSTALSTMQEAIVEALERHTEGPMLGNELADAAGYRATGGAWKRALAGLVDMGRIGNGGRGYLLKSPLSPGAAPGR